MKTVVYLIAFLIVAITAPFSPAQSTRSTALSGTFYVTADDHAMIYLNGKPLMEAKWNKKNKVRRSDEVDVRPGDRLVFQLENVGGGRSLMVQFVTSDLKTVISFPSNTFRILPNPEATDFAATAFDFGNLPKAEKQADDARFLPFKSDSQATWGSTDICALGAVINAEMIRPAKQ